MLGTLLMSGALYGLNRLLDPKQKKRSRVYEFDSWESDPDRGGAVPLAYGRNRMSGSVVFRDQAGGDQYDAAVALCEGEIEGVDEDSIDVDGKSLKADIVDGGSEYQVYTGTPEQVHNEWFEKGSFTLPVLRDASINEGMPDAEGHNNRVRREGGEDEQIAFVKFDISTVPDGATITGATIRLKKSSGHFTGYATAQECGNTWADDVTWNDHPPIGTTRSTYAFHDSGSGPTNPPDTITDSSGNFINDGFTAGMYITVYGSANNDGVYKIASLTASTITLRQVDELTDEAAGVSIQIAPSSRGIDKTMYREIPVYEVVSARHAAGADYVSFAIRGIQDPLYPSYNRGVDMEYSSMELGTKPPELYVEYSYANPSAYRHLAYIALRLIASDRLSGGSEHTVTAVVDGLKVRQWDDAGEEWVTAFSRNPAWIILDILTNGRWPAPIADSWIDLDSFKAAASYWAADVTLSDGTTEPRALCDIVFDTQTSKAAAIEQVLQTCGGWLVRRQGKIALVPEKAETVSHTFDMSNIALAGSEYDAQSSFSYNEIAWTNRPNRVEVEFINAANDFEKGYETWEDEDDQDERCLIPLTLQVYGITRRSQASRMARLILGKYDLHRYQARLSGGIASTGVVAGDVVSVTHPVAGWTAREFRVIGTSEKFNDEISLVLEEYNASLYNDTGKPYTPPQEPVFESPERIPPDVMDLTLTETYKTLDDGTYLPLVKVAFTPPGNLARPLNYLIFWRKGTDPWVPVPQIEHYDNSAVTYYLEAMETGTYTVKVQTIDIYSGVRSAFPEEATITVLGKTTVPTAPGTPTLTAIAGGLVIDWTAVADGDVKGYNVYIDTASPATTFTAFVQATSWTFRGLGNQLYHVRITAVNSAGESVFSPEASGTTLAEGDYQVDDIDVPMPSGIVWSTNSRAEWTGGHIVYKGTIYSVVSGNTTLKYIYWDADSANTQLQASATEPTLGANAWVLAIYDSASDTLDLAMMGKIINGALFKAASIHGNKLLLTSINTSGLNNDAGWTDDSTANGKASVYRQASEPASGMQAGDVWFDIDDGNRPHVYDGSSWVRAYTLIDGGDLVTGSVDANKVKAGTFRTGDTGKRILMDGIDGSLAFYGSDGLIAVKIDDGIGDSGTDRGVEVIHEANKNTITAHSVVIVSRVDRALVSLYGEMDDGTYQVLFAGHKKDGTITSSIDKEGHAYFADAVECATPYGPTHAATKQYVDDAVSGVGGVTAHGELTGVTADQHHAKQHNILDAAHHSVSASLQGYFVRVDPSYPILQCISPSTVRSAIDAAASAHSHVHAAITGISENQHHAKQHSLTDTANHTTGGSSLRYLHANISGAPEWRSHAQVLGDIGAAAFSHTHGSGDITGGYSGSKRCVIATGTNPGTGNPGYQYVTETWTNGVLTGVSSASWADE